MNSHQDTTSSYADNTSFSISAQGKFCIALGVSAAGAALFLAPGAVYQLAEGAAAIINIGPGSAVSGTTRLIFSLGMVPFGIATVTAAVSHVAISEVTQRL